MHRQRSIASLGSTIALPCLAAAQQKAVPVVGFLNLLRVRRTRIDQPSMRFVPIKTEQQAAPLAGRMTASDPAPLRAA
jgi:hypothetical protein